MGKTSEKKKSHHQAPYRNLSSIVNLPGHGGEVQHLQKYEGYVKAGPQPDGVYKLERSSDLR